MPACDFTPNQQETSEEENQKIKITKLDSANNSPEVFDWLTKFMIKLCEEKYNLYERGFW